MLTTRPAFSNLRPFVPGSHVTPFLGKGFSGQSVVTRTAKTATTGNALAFAELSNAPDWVFTEACIGLSGWRVGRLSSWSAGIWRGYRSRGATRCESYSFGYRISRKSPKILKSLCCLHRSLEVATMAKHTQRVTSGGIVARARVLPPLSCAFDRNLPTPLVRKRACGNRTRTERLRPGHRW